MAINRFCDRCGSKQPALSARCGSCGADQTDALVREAGSLMRAFNVASAASKFVKFVPGDRREAAREFFNRFR